MAVMVQGNPEWLDARCGKVTTSRIADILAVKRDGNPSASRRRQMPTRSCTVSRSNGSAS